MQMQFSTSSSHYVEYLRNLYGFSSGTINSKQTKISKRLKESISPSGISKRTAIKHIRDKATTPH